MTSKLKRIIALVSVVCLTVCLLAGTALANEKQSSIEYTEIPLYVGGTNVGNGMKIEATTYVGIRAFCDLVSDKTAEISWNGETQTVTVNTNGLHLTATAGGNIVANDTTIVPVRQIINLNGTVIVPIRDIAGVFDVEVLWNNANWSIDLDLTNLRYGPSDDVIIGSGSSISYTEDDLYWLSRIISAEAKNQPIEGMIGVGNVILNRVASSDFPNTIYDVIFDDQYGVQFSPTSNGTIYDTPTDKAIEAALMCFEGQNTVGESLYFLNPSVSDDSWFRNNLTFVTTIQDHDFYAA